MACTSEEFIKMAQDYLGVKEGSKRHHQLVDIYNTIKPLPRGYKLKYTDPWCAGFLSAIARQTNSTDIVYPECSANEMKKLFARHSRIVPISLIKRGDIIFYDWDCNGSEDHVGIVVSQLNQERYLKVVEGNKNDEVGERKVDIKRKYVSCIARPKWTRAKGLENRDRDSYEKLNRVAREVIRGRWGDGEERRVRLAAAGWNYIEVQKMVNQILKGDD